MTYTAPAGSYRMEDLDDGSLVQAINRYSYFPLVQLGHIHTQAAGVRFAQAVNRDMLHFLKQGYDIGEEGFVLLMPYVKDFQEGYYGLEGIQKIRNAADKVVQIQELLESMGEDIPNLLKKYAEIPEATALFEDLKKIVNVDGEVMDTASDKLKAIRQEIKFLKQELYEELGDMVRTLRKKDQVPPDMDLTIYNGRMVIPIRSEYKRQIKGSSRGESGGGFISYLEPPQAMEMNNRLFELYQAEEQELEYIIQFTGNRLGRSAEKIQTLEDTLVEIDLDRAKGWFHHAHNWNFPEIKAGYTCNFKNARHTELLLQTKEGAEEIKGNAIELQEAERLMVVSGPNGGGKTIYMKTLGILQLAAQAGLAIPVDEGSYTGVFEQCYFHIGDWQNVREGESTFTGKLSFIKEVLQLDSPALLLIDEFGSGTESETGGALAEALLEHFAEQKLYGILTTHLTNLKLAAERIEHVLNGAMMYNDQEQRPSFVFRKGHYGSSMALQAAQQVGLPMRIILRAKELAGHQKAAAEDLLQKLNERETKLEEAELQLQAAQAEAHRAEKKHKQALDRLTSEKAQTLRAAKKEAEDLLEAANRKIENTIRKIRESQADKASSKAARKDLEEFKEKVKMKPVPETEPKKENKPTESKSDTSIQVGDTVEIEGSGATGEVLSIKGKEAEVAMGALKSTIKLKRLKKLSRKEQKKKQKTKRAGTTQAKHMMGKKQGFNPELDVRGLRTEEALLKVQDFVDNAVMLSQDQVSIIHGKGEGILKKMIRQHLKTHPHIKEMHDGHPDQGGAGVTEVVL